MRIATNGITLHAVERGGTDPALLFLHYWGGTARSWETVIAALPEGRRAIALDSRGWGGSDRPEGGYDVRTLADDVATAVAALGLGRYVLVGHSMGGKVAQLLASRRPEGLAGLVLVAPSPAGGKALAEAERRGMAEAYATEDSVARTIDAVLAGRALEPRLRAQVIADSLGGAPAAKRAWPMSAIGEDVGAELSRIAVPVLVIGGGEDRVDGVAMLRERVVPVLPGAVLEVIPGAGHLLPLEAPEELAGRIERFVSGLDGAGSRMPNRPEELPAAFDAALNGGDLDAVMALFHPRATMRTADGDVIVEDPAALRAAMGGLVAAGARLRNNVRRVLRSENVALLLLDWEIRLSPPGGEEVVRRGTATQVAECRAAGGWRLRIANPLGID